MLQEVIENQKKMETKQEDFDNKLDDLTKRSESSCSSPDKQNKRKFKIKRTLTVSECHLISNFIFLLRKVAVVYDSLDNGFRSSEGYVLLILDNIAHCKSLT